jgi:hypothetical protein
MKRHQSFVVNASRPDVTGSFAIGDNGFAHIGPFIHKILVGKRHLLKNLAPIRELLCKTSAANQNQQN